jgi:hypothetical protein
VYYPGFVLLLTVPEFIAREGVEGLDTGYFQGVHAAACCFFRQKQCSEQPSVRLLTGFVFLEKVLAVQLLTGGHLNVRCPHRISSDWLNQC